MKKIITAALICAVCSIFPIGVSMAEGSIGDDDVFSHNTICAVTGDDVLGDEYDRAVTRDEFTGAVVSLFYKDSTVLSEKSFEDVGEDNQYKKQIETAYEMGLISDNNLFYPQNPIKTEEALKIALKATEYSNYADLLGGYPDGYMSAAVSFKLLKNVNRNANGTITVRDAYNMLFNIMSANVMTADYSVGKISYHTTDENYFSLLYDIYEGKGIVTATEYSAITLNVSTEERQIKINGEPFVCDCTDYSLLGKNVRYYALRDDNEIIAVAPYRNNETYINGEDILSVNDGRIVYDDNGSRKRISADKFLTTIYNGRPVEQFDEKYITTNCETVRFLDNNNDGVYDIVFIDQNEYHEVESVDTAKETLGLDNFVYIDFNEKGNVKYYEIQNSAGELIELYELKPGDIVALRMSEDGAFVRIAVCGDAVSGTVKSINREEKIIQINETEYTYSSEIEEKYIASNVVKLGSTVYAVLGAENSIAFIQNIKNTFEFGFFKKVDTAKADLGRSFDIDDGVIMEVYASSGKHMRFGIAKKVMIDGEKKTSEDAYNILRTYTGGCFLRYELDNDGRVSKLDFPEAYDSAAMTFGSTKENNNNLICYKDQTTMTYRGGSKAFPPFCVVTKANIFFIPKDITDDEEFAIIAYTDLYDNEAYKISVYNIDDEGKAEAVVIYETSNSASLDQACSSFIIEKIVMAANEDGEWGTKLYGWSDGEFKTVHIPESVQVVKKSGKGLTPGDIIRYKTADGQVQKIYVDYDCSSGEPVAESGNGGRWDLPLGNAYCSYHDGGVYRFGSDTVFFSSKRSEETGLYDFSFENLNVYLNTSKMVCYNRLTKQLRTISADEVREYLGYGDDCHRVILRQSYARPQAIFIIE